jgi:hypothetical protein
VPNHDGAASDCARRAKLASSPEIKAYHRRLRLQWIKIAEKARVAGSRTRSVTCTLPGVPCTAARCPISEALPNSAYLSKVRRAGQNIAVVATVIMIFLWW